LRGRAGSRSGENTNFSHHGDTWAVLIVAPTSRSTKVNRVNAFDFGRALKPELIRIQRAQERDEYAYTD